MANQPVRLHLGGVLDKVSRQLRFAHLRQVRGVGGVIAADDQEQVQRLLQELAQGILPVLGGAANGVEEAEMRLHPGLAVLLRDGAAQAALHFLRFAPQHGRLVGHADGPEVNVGVKSFRAGALELFEEGGLVAALQDVIADVVRLLQREDDEVMAAAADPRLRAGGLGLLMPGLAVNDAGDVILRILADAFPDAHDVAAGRIHKPAAFGFELLPHGDFHPESGNNDNVILLQVGDVRVLFAAGEELDAHRADLIVDLRVMDDFAEDVERLIGEDLPRGIGQVNGPLDAVAKAELLGEPDRQVARCQHIPVAANALDQAAAIVRQHLGLNCRHDIRAAQVDLPGDNGRIG